VSPLRATHGIIVAAILVSIGAPTSVELTYPKPTADVDIIATQTSTLTAGRDCTPEGEPRLVDHVIINDVNTIVVREVDFATAYDLASHGRATVLAYCSN
jgi:hypothetical protein